MTDELSQRALLEAASEGLRRLAADSPVRTSAPAGPGAVLQDILAPAARRYVPAPDRAGFLERADRLRTKGYLLSAEYTTDRPCPDDPAEVERTVAEYLALLAHEPVPERLGFDLAQVGLARSARLATRNTGRIVTAAASRGSEVVLSMGPAPGVDTVLDAYRELRASHTNLGITLQAHLHRTPHDAAELARPGSTIRLVKGASPEPGHIALPRGPALDDRYLDLAQLLLERGVRLSLATQDPALLASARQRGLLRRTVEIEMLHGVQPALLRRYRQDGLVCRIHAPYGTGWWPHLLQRLAEHPPMVLRALADIGTDGAAPAENSY
ncbi:proline dehydrogenase family protein [Streptomyces sp. TE33382]